LKGIHSPGYNKTSGGERTGKRRTRIMELKPELNVTQYTPSKFKCRVGTKRKRRGKERAETAVREGIITTEP